MKRSLMIVSVVTTLVAGCGADDETNPVASDEEQVRAVAMDFYAAVDAGDGEAGCALLTGDSLALHSQDGGGDCAAGFELYYVEGTKTPEIAEVRIKGTSASVVDANGDTLLELVNEDNAWMISDDFFV